MSLNDELQEARVALRLLCLAAIAARAAVANADIEQVALFPVENAPERLGAFLRRTEAGLQDLLGAMGVSL